MDTAVDKSTETKVKFKLVEMAMGLIRALLQEDDDKNLHKALRNLSKYQEAIK